MLPILHVFAQILTAQAINVVLLDHIKHATAAHICLRGGAIGLIEDVSPALIHILAWRVIILFHEGVLAAQG